MKFCSACNKTYDEGLSFCPSDGEVLQESPHTLVGRVLDGKYRVEGFIAQGGMGAVYRARHILLGDQVVIKTLRPEMRDNAAWLKRFQREGKAARAFRHPNSVTVYDLSAGGDGLTYLVMEYVEGRTLDKELKARGRFTPSEALEVLEPVADVLDAAHARGVVHRDLKPGNIMLGPDGRGGTTVKVLDLGIAKMIGAGEPQTATSLTLTGQILGTPHYMSPEQWGETPRDGGAGVDGRADVYSLGVIFFELVAGRKPLGGRTPTELRQKHASETLPALSASAPGVPEAFSRAVARAMAKDRADRQQTAGLLVEELRASLGLPARTRPSGLHAPAAGIFAAASPRAASSQGRADEEATHSRADEEATHDRAPAGTAPAAPHTRANDEARLEGGRADSVLTSDSDSTPAAVSGRETNVQRADAQTGGKVPTRRDAVERTADAEGTQTAPAADVHAVRRETAGAALSAPKPRRKLAPLVAFGVLALLLAAGLGVWLAWKGSGAKPAQPPTKKGADHANSPAGVPKTEVASFWFETFDRPEDAAGRRVAEASPALASGQRFRFHFAPKTRGYLYIVGPGAGGNAPTTLLTAQGAGALRSNLVVGGADFSFPSLNGARLKLDDNPGADEFTFIFSPTPLMSPAFLAGKYLHELSPAEVKELEDFRAQFNAAAPEMTARGEGGERRITVLAPPQAPDENRPLIFDVRIDHR